MKLSTASPAESLPRHSRVKIMSELFHTSGATRAYPSRPICFAEFEAFASEIPEATVVPFRDSWDDQRDIAIIDHRTGDVELIVAQLASDHVGFYVRSSPSCRIQRLVCERFGVEVVVNRLSRRLDFILAETASLQPARAGRLLHR